MLSVKDKKWGTSLSILLLTGFAFGSTGCKEKNKIIDRVVTKVSENLETVKVSLIFNSRIQTNFSGGVGLKNYGYLFVNPPVQNQPLEAGFELNTSIVNEQDYVNITPTGILPNGYPLGVPNTLVQVRSDTPSGSEFDLYGYVDVMGKSWLGAATMLKVLNDYFPDGLAFTQVFLNDKNGKPAIIGHAYGPTRDASGQILTHGGIAVLANVRFLIQQKEEQPHSYQQAQVHRAILTIPGNEMTAEMLRR